VWAGLGWAGLGWVVLRLGSPSVDKMETAFFGFGLILLLRGESDCVMSDE